jgi:hypothetical protein
MNKPSIVALATLAIFFSATAASLQVAHAQYGGVESTTAPTEEQQAKCDKYDIPQSQCTELSILAKERLIAAQENPSTGSGTSMVSTEEGATWAFVGILAAIFGGVAAAFFLRGRGQTPPS